MTYAVETDSWDCTEYSEVGYHIQPVMHHNQILACVRQTNMEKEEHGEYECKKYDEEKNQWQTMQIDVKNCMAHQFLFTIKTCYK